MDPAQLEGTLDRVQEWTRACDQKVSIAVLVETAFAALYLPSLPGWFTDPDLAGYRLAIALAATLWLASLGAAGMALFARTTNPHGKSLTFFGDIAGMKLEDYRAAVGAATPESMRDDFIGQVHACAEICGKKHFWAKWTLGLFFGSVAVLLAAYVRLGLG